MKKPLEGGWDTMRKIDLSNSRSDQVGAFLCVLAIWVLWGMAGRDVMALLINQPRATFSDVGAWGDTFGAINALFAALAFIGVIWTLALQREQLSDQREEITAQQVHLNSSERTQNVQRFERTFFELLHLLRQERQSLFFRYSDDYLAAMARRGRRLSPEDRLGTLAVRAALREARHWLAVERRIQPLTKQRAAHVYALRIHGRYEGSLGPYFRLIYTILRSIKEDEWMTDDERLRYARLLRSQLTSHEAGLIGINALATFSKNLSDLVSEYRLLKYASAGTKTLLQPFYPATTFLGREG